MKIKSILVSQPKPEGDKSPYFDLAKKFKIKIEFHPFIQIEGIPYDEFRRTRISLLDHTAVIMTSKNSVDHFFRMCRESKVKIPESLKYFCISEATAFYIQKYIMFRKRKVFYGKQTVGDLMDTIKKHSHEKFLLPCTDIHKEEIAERLDMQKLNYTKAVMYRTVASDLNGVDVGQYDVLVFFSPSGIASLKKNFPKFQQREKIIACFGPSTAKAAKDVGLNINIHAPNPKAPSMTMALEQFILTANKTK